MLDPGGSETKSWVTIIVFVQSISEGVGRRVIALHA